MQKAGFLTAQLILLQSVTVAELLTRLTVYSLGNTVFVVVTCYFPGRNKVHTVPVRANCLHFQFVHHKLSIKLI